MLSPSNSTPGKAAGHIAILAYSMQCGADRGVSASVQSGYFVCGGNSQSVHSKHGVTYGGLGLERVSGSERAKGP